MKFTASLIASAIAVLATMSLETQAKPVSSTGGIASELCFEHPTNVISIKSDINSQKFQDTYYTAFKTYVPEATNLTLDSVTFSSDCGIAYCKKEVPTFGKRDEKTVTAPKGSDCILPPRSVSTFTCQGSKGKVVLSVDRDGKASFTAESAVAYFGSWKKDTVVPGKGKAVSHWNCVEASKEGISLSKSGDKDYLIVDCSGKFEKACVPDDK